MALDSVRLDGLLANQVQVQWQEGVAIVQAVCRELIARGTSANEFPGAGEISISSDGAVRVVGTTSTRALSAAAHLLAAMLSDDVPVRLRLAVTQATADNGTGTLREFSETLAYFERPDAQKVVRGFFERALLAPARSSEDAAPLNQYAKEPERDAREPQLEPARRTRRWPLVAASAAVVIAIGGWSVRTGVAKNSFAAAVDVVSGMFPPPAAATPGTPESQTEKSSAPKQRASGTRPVAIRPDSQPGQTRATSGGNRQYAIQEGSSASLVFAPSQLPLLVQTLSPVTSNIDETVHVMTAEPEGGANPIYSRSDAAVTAPRQVYPTLPAEPPTAFRQNDRTILELVIAADGLVERVRLRTRPRDVHEFMLLSAAKAWRFQPAMLDGRPVRFLHSVAITTME